MKQRLLIIDDELRSVEQLQREIKGLNLDVVVMRTQADAYTILSLQSFHVALVDMKLAVDSEDLNPDVEVGYATIRRLRKDYPDMKLVAITAFDEKSEVNTTAIKAGADDFWSKRIDASESLKSKIRKLMDGGITAQNYVTSDKSNNSEHLQKNGTLLKSQESMDDIRRRIKKLATTDATILLMGETGTGKGYFAEDIHKQSNRKSKAFLTLNCPQLTKETIVSELFGHEKGSFTGADKKRQGLAPSAAGGTLFFDEIEALDLECQAVILRFIDQKEIKPHGSDKPEILDIRFIIASNQDLAKLVSSGRFREDLYSRLSGVVIVVPPLHERGSSEIERLARYFYRTFRKENIGSKGYSDVRVSDSVWSALSRIEYDWPLNVRELRHVIWTTLLEVGGKSARLEDFVKRIKIADYGLVAEGFGLSSIETGLELSEDERKVIKLIQATGCVSRAEVETALGLKSTSSWNLLRSLQSKGLIIRKGKGRNSKYFQVLHST